MLFSQYGKILTMINNNSLSYVRTNALNPDKVDCLIEHGWDVLGSGASIGDRPHFLLFNSALLLRLTMTAVFVIMRFSGKPYSMLMAARVFLFS